MLQLGLLISPGCIRMHHCIVDFLLFFLQVVEMVEINFLCVHKKLRAKRLAPVLIKVCSAA